MLEQAVDLRLQLGFYLQLFLQLLISEEFAELTQLLIEAFFGALVWPLLRGRWDIAFAEGFLESSLDSITITDLLGWDAHTNTVNMLIQCQPPFLPQGLDDSHQRTFLGNALGLVLFEQCVL